MKRPSRGKVVFGSFFYGLVAAFIIHWGREVEPPFLSYLLALLALLAFIWFLSR